MPKKVLEDMVRVKRASRGTGAEAAAPAQETTFKETKRTDRALDSIQEEPKKLEDPRAGRPRQYGLWLVAAASVVFFLFALSYLVFKATVAVNPRVEEVNLNQNLSAVKDGGEEALRFDLIALSGEESKTTVASGARDVSKRAEGTVVIYNAFGPAAQLLSVDTRLEGSNGKIYRTRRQIAAPGMKGGIPGSIEVGIYASESGEAYNSPPLDFKIFGFKGTPKYAKFYARSKDPIEGGFTGQVPFLSDSEKSAVLETMKSSLEASLFRKAGDQIPAGLVMFLDGVLLQPGELSVETADSGGNLVSLKLSGTLYGLLFNAEELAKKIAESNIGGYDGSAVFMPNIQDLNFSLLNKNSLSFEELKSASFHLSGQARIVFKVDDAKLAGVLAGRSKKDFSAVLTEYPSIASADLRLSPFWKMSLPDNPEDIRVIVNYPK